MAAQAAGDGYLRREAQRRILELEAEYERISQAAGLEPRFERMRVEGFKDMSIRERTGTGSTPQALPAAGGSGIIGYQAEQIKKANRL